MNEKHWSCIEGKMWKSLLKLSQLSKCLMRGGELGVDKYLLGSDALLRRSVLLCDRPLFGKKKNEGVFSQWFFSLFFPLNRWSASPIPGRADARREEKV